MPNGTFIDVRGGLCAGDVACGANGMASNSSRITFNWQDPANASATGSCAGIFNNNHYNRDPSCNEGILLRSTVDVGATKLNHVSITNAYGTPRWVQKSLKYATVRLLLRVQADHDGIKIYRNQYDQFAHP